jgi:hypothetical protein
MFGETISKKNKERISSTPELVENPISYLFDDIEITDMARNAGLDDIKVFEK